MRVIFVVDSVDDLNAKINLVKTNLSEDIVFVVKANLAKLFNTFGYFASAVYGNNLARILHYTLSRLSEDDTVVCYSSVKLSKLLLTNFVSRIGDKTKFVNVMPKYNAFEKFANGCYSIYCKSMFKVQDGLISPKLQFLPKAAVGGLVASHISNRLFAMPDFFTSTLFVEDASVNKTLKVKSRFNKYAILPIIFALVITATLIMSLAFWGAGYIVIFVHVALYVLDAILGVIFQCKNYFDQRFFR